VKKLGVALRHGMADSLYRNSFYLFLSSGSTALTGFLFWTIAARLFPPAEVGIVSTLIAAATFIGSASIFGLDHTLIHYLGKHPKKIFSILNTAFTVAVIGVVVIGLLYVLVVPIITPELDFIASSLLWLGGFILLMLVTTWNNLLNSVFIGLRITYFVLLAGLFFGVLRIVLLPIFNSYGLPGLLSAHLLAFGIGVVVAFICIFRAKKYVFVPRITSDVIRLIKGYSLKTYAASLLASMPPLLTPLFVITWLGPSAAAYYAMPLMVVGLLTIIPMATSQSLFAEGVSSSSDLRRHSIRAIKFIYALIIPAAALVIIAGKWVLGFFGAAYADQGYVVLVLLSVALVFKAGSFPLVAVLRIVGDIKEIIIVSFIYTLFVISAMYIAITSAHALWAVGAVMVVAEIIALVLYGAVLLRKWPKISNHRYESTLEEPLNA
jgi:O-antigen/teichoic acid export membrane protein